MTRRDNRAISANFELGRLPMKRNPSKLPAPNFGSGWALRRYDQAMVAVAVLFGIAGLAGYWIIAHRSGDGLIEIEREVSQHAQFQVDVNRAEWPELSQLPDVGETLARRIVTSRDEQGPFNGVDDLERVRGIGPRTVEKIRPYLAPIAPAQNVAGP